MTKEHFIQLADAIAEHNTNALVKQFDTSQIETLADFCRAQNSQFNRKR